MAEAAADVKPDVKPSVGSTVTLKLKSSTEASTSFKVKKTTKFSKIANAYAAKQGRRVEEYNFIFDGNRISGTSEDTVESLHLEDGDQIDVALAQVGGCCLR